MVYILGIVLLFPSHVLVDLSCDLDVIPNLCFNRPVGGCPSRRSDMKTWFIPIGIIRSAVMANPHNVSLHFKGHGAVQVSPANLVGLEGGEVGGLELIHCGVLSFGKFEF